MDFEENDLQYPAVTHRLFQLITEMSDDERRTLLARRLVKQGAEVVHLGCCVVGDCPYFKMYRKALVAEGITVVDNTHELPPPEMRRQIHERIEAREKEKERILKEHGF